MSSIYHTEPPTSGKVLLKTSHGEIDVELWPREAPKACRNFVQLALEGYYDDTVFHRVIPKVLVQGGDPTGTGSGGESVYGKPFRDEIHSRIKFNHRGQVAMANSNEPNTNLSQFFVTLDRADWLDKKHTIFGKVTGSTIFNALRLGDCEVDSNDRPQDPPRLLSVEVLVNPFDDVVARATHLKQPKLTAKEKAAEAKAVKRKARGKAAAKKDFAVLSFGDEAEEEERGGGSGSSAITTGMRSAHDVLEDERLRREKAYEEEELAASAGGTAAAAAGGGGGGGISDNTSKEEGGRRKGMLKRQPSRISSAVAGDDEEGEEPGGEDKPDDGDIINGEDEDGSSSFMQRMKQQMADKRRRLEGGSSNSSGANGKSSRGGSGRNGNGTAAATAAAAAQDEGAGADLDIGVDKLADLRSEKRAAAAAKAEEYERLREELRAKHTRARKVLAGEERSKYDAEKQAHDMLTPLQQMRQKYKARRQVQGSREEETLAKLAAFTSTIRTKAAAAKPAAAKSGGEGDGDGNAKEPSSVPPADAVSGAARGSSKGGKEKVDESQAPQGYHGQVTEGALYEGDEDDSTWFAGKLKFTKHIDDQYRMGGGTKGSDGRDANDYEVIDERKRRGGAGNSGGGMSMTGESERRMRGREMGGKRDGWGSDRPPDASRH